MKGVQTWDGKGGSVFVAANHSALDTYTNAVESSGYLASTSCPSPGESIPRWFALRVKSNFERTAALHLRQRGYQEFLPMYTVRAHWSDRMKNVDRPLFPGYVFCNFSTDFRFPILTTPGVLHIVGIGKEPVPVDDIELQALTAASQSGLLVTPWPFLQVGERVVVERGPLAGVEGIVTQLKGTYRLVVSITLLQRSIAAEIERDWIRPTVGVRTGQNSRKMQLPSEVRF